MTVREIKDLTLELARTGDRVDALIQARRTDAQARFERLLARSFPENPELVAAPLIIRAAAIPLTPQTILKLTSRRDLWWCGRPFKLKVGDEELRCEYPARDFQHHPKIRLRGLYADNDLEDAGVRQIVLDNGWVEFEFIRPALNPNLERSREMRVLYLGWLATIVIATLAQVEKLRLRLAWDGVEFALGVEIWSAMPLNIKWSDSPGHRGILRDARPLALPAYTVGSRDTFDQIINDVIQDIWNASGTHYQDKCEVPWSQLEV